MAGNDELEPAQRLMSNGSEYGQELLRSARLDRLSAGAARRGIESTLTAAAFGRAARERRKRVWLGAAALALAAVFALFVSSQRRQQVAVSAEPAVSHSATLAVSAREAPPALPPCPNPVVASGDSLLIDDLEDRNARLLVQDGRFGIWQSSGDRTGKQTPPADQNAFPALIPGGRAGSKYALHAFGERLTASGSALTVNFAPGHCYDASKYAGVEFWARGKGRIHLGFTMVDVMASEWGGLCKINCYDQHRKPFDLDSHWKRYTARWEELRQVGWGAPLTFDPHRLLSLAFMVDSADTPFDYWVDDPGFVER